MINVAVGPSAPIDLHVHAWALECTALSASPNPVPELSPNEELSASCADCQGHESELLTSFHAVVHLLLGCDYGTSLDFCLWSVFASQLSALGKEQINGIL